MVDVTNTIFGPDRWEPKEGITNEDYVRLCEEYIRIRDEFSAIRSEYSPPLISMTVHPMSQEEFDVLAKNQNSLLKWDEDLELILYKEVGYEGLIAAHELSLYRDELNRIMTGYISNISPNWARKHANNTGGSDK